MKRTILIIFLSVVGACTPTGYGHNNTEGDTDGYDDTDSDSADVDSGAPVDSSTDTDADSDTDSDSDSDTDTETESTTETGSETDEETDTDSDTETESETEIDTDTPGDCIGPGVYWQPVENKCWEVNPPAVALPYVDAEARCDSLDLDGVNDWRLPNINELQMLIEGCSVPGCGVYETGCLYDYCDDSCPVCTLYAGPGVGGCYWLPELDGPCAGAGYWSTSEQMGVSYTARWCINFASAGFMFAGGGSAYSRCIR